MIENAYSVVVVVADGVPCDGQIISSGGGTKAVFNNTPISAGDCVVCHHHSVVSTAVNVHRIGIVCRYQ